MSTELSAVAVSGPEAHVEQMTTAVCALHLLQAHDQIAFDFTLHSGRDADVFCVAPGRLIRIQSPHVRKLVLGFGLPLLSRTRPPLSTFGNCAGMSLSGSAIPGFGVGRRDRFEPSSLDKKC